MPLSLESELWNQGLKLVSYCPVCDTRYNSMQAHVLGTQASTHFMHVRCRKCAHSVLALVLVNPVGASSIGILTDLSYEDVMRFKRQRVVTIDDVIATHMLFETPLWHERLGSPAVARASRSLRKKRIQPEKAQKHEKARESEVS